MTTYRSTLATKPRPAPTYRAIEVKPPLCLPVVGGRPHMTATITCIQCGVKRSYSAFQLTEQSVAVQAISQGWDYTRAGTRGARAWCPVDRERGCLPA